MVHIRIEGMPEEVEKAQEYLYKCCNVVSASGKQYRNRAPSQDVRVYMTIKIPEDKPGQLTDQNLVADMKTAYEKSKKENLI